MEDLSVAYGRNWDIREDNGQMGTEVEIRLQMSHNELGLMRRGVGKLLHPIESSRRIIHNWTKPELECITADLEIEASELPLNTAPQLAIHSPFRSLSPPSNKLLV